MNKFFVALIALALVFGALTIAGCGNDTPKAQSYMKKGEKAFDSAGPAYQQIDTKLTTLVTDFNSGKNADPNSVKAQADDIRALINKAQATENNAKDEFDKILSLSGVEDYQKYAELAMSGVDKMKQMNSSLNQLLDMIQSAVASGQSPDSAKLLTIETNLQKLGTDVQTLRKQAESLKSEKNL